MGPPNFNVSKNELTIFSWSSSSELSLLDLVSGNGQRPALGLDSHEEGQSSFLHMLPAIINSCPAYVLLLLN